MSQPVIFQFDEIAWVDERAEAHPSAASYVADGRRLAEGLAAYKQGDHDAALKALTPLAAPETCRRWHVLEGSVTVIASKRPF